MAIVLTGYGGTTPEDACAAVAEELPDLYAAYGKERILAVCEEVQHSEIPEQSALEMYRTFNGKYFEGRLPRYRILVVYDVWFWETKRCGFSPCFPPAAEATGFIDFEERRILIRFLAFLRCGSTMQESLIHEMAHAATDGGHGDNWKAEMLRLKQLGAPVNELDLLDEITPQDVITLRHCKLAT
jgi:hypothetical protein